MPGTSITEKVPGICYFKWAFLENEFGFWMKYLVVIIFMVSSFYINGQNKEEILKESDPLEMNKYHYMISGGGILPNFAPLFLRLSYRYRLNKNLYIPFEGEVVNFDLQIPYPIFSISLRGYTRVYDSIILYGQGGLGAILLISPMINIGTGINYKNIDVGLRFFFTSGSSSEGLVLTPFLSIGLKI